jgi:uncharacterized membrane protein YeaQ/YmgE (transglycosylase-associated protein family)
MSDLWLGILLSIPIGIAINLVSPAILTRLSQRNQKAAERRAAQDVAVRDRAARLAKDRPALYTYLLETLVRVAWIGALFGVVGGAFAFAAQSLTTTMGGYRIPGVLYAAAQLVALIGAIIVLNIAREALGLIRLVKDVDAGYGSDPSL